MEWSVATLAIPLVEFSDYGNQGLNKVGQGSTGKVFFKSS
jgi:hypothetical protein